jgi:hypothetical protein
MRIFAAQRLSEKSNQEKITHYTKMLQRVKHRLHQLDYATAPKTTRHYIAWALRLEKRIAKLKTRHRY